MVSDIPADSLIKLAALILGGLGIASFLAFAIAQLPRVLGASSQKLDDKYFTVDFSGIFLWLGASCVVVGFLLWLGRGVVAKMF
jgi:hypothetical protein